MSHYEHRLQSDLDAIRTGISQLGRDVHAALTNAVKALLDRNDELSYATILGDHPVNRSVDRLNLECHRFIAKHLPSAGHLRFISSSLRTIILMERLGDYASTIAKESVHLEDEPRGAFRNDLQSLAYDALDMLASAIKAYEAQDANLATQTSSIAQRVDREFITALGDLVSIDKAHIQRKDLFANLNIINLIERVSDQAKNVCEEVVFTVTGQTKQRRPFRLLFLDKTDAGVTQIAVALSRKYYADRVISQSAGSHPSADLKSDIRAMCQAKGLDLSGLDPSLFMVEGADWRSADVIVCIDEDVSTFMPKVPYGRAVVRWNTPKDSDTEGLFRFISERLETLVLLVRGPGSNTESNL